MSMPQIPAVTAEQALVNMIQAMAMQEAAIASIFHAEAAKIDALVAAGIPGAKEIAEVNGFQTSVKQLIEVLCQRQQATLERLEMMMAMMRDQA
jgi:hypothetical protein